MAGPATSASEPRALQLVAVMVPRSSLGTMVARVWGRTPKITRNPSRACNNHNNVIMMMMMMETIQILSSLR